MELILMAFLLVGSAFFSASETALFSIPRYQLRKLHQKPGLGGRSIILLLENQRGLLVTVLLGNMFVNVLYASLAVLYGAGLAKDHGHFVFILVDALSLVVLIIVGEVVPKSVAVNLPLPAARIFAPVLLVFRTVIFPVRVVFDTIVKAVTAVVLPRREEEAATIQDLANLVEIGSDHGLLTPVENEMLREVIEFGTIEVREVMTPRIDLSLYDVDAGKEGLLKLLRSSKHSKIPVWRDDQDNIIGVLHSKDIYLYPEKELESMTRPVMFFPETARIDYILRVLLAKQQTIAIVVDEYGGLEGIVTIEDIVEEIVGDIKDEYDREKHRITRLSQGRYLVSSGTTLREWNDMTGETLADEKIETVSGMVAMMLDRLPEKGDSAKLQNYRFTVLRAVNDQPEVFLAEKQRRHDARSKEKH